MALAFTGLSGDTAKDMKEVQAPIVSERSAPLSKEERSSIGSLYVNTPKGVKKVEEYEAEKEKTSPELLQKSLDALKNYFGISVNQKDYETDFSRLEGCEDAKAEMNIFFSSLRNIGNDGFRLKKAVMPEFTVSFFEDQSLKAIYLLEEELIWGETSKITTVEEAKQIAKEFVISTRLIPENEIELLGASVTNDRSISVVFKEGKHDALAVQVGIKNGKVTCFDHLTKERGMKWITPVKEGSGLG